MRIINNNKGNIIIENGDKHLRINLALNQDLYWSLNGRNVEVDNTFIITKENYQLYNLFSDLFSDIENINLFDNVEEDFKERYRLNNQSHYNELFNPDTRTITWYSDETYYKVSNYLTIKDNEEEYVISFNTQPNKDNYDIDFKSQYYVPIRFRNNGSRYRAFNSVFMKMYYNLNKIDNTYDYGHQYHIEEYMYNKKLVMKK